MFLFHNICDFRKIIRFFTFLERSIGDFPIFALQMFVKLVKYSFIAKYFPVLANCFVLPNSPIKLIINYLQI